jgi:hypothetical protein
VDPLPRPTPCPGSHNDAWRAAEQRRREHGEQHELNPGYGVIRWCTPCAQRTETKLLALPLLFSQLHIELAEATVPRNHLSGGRGGGSGEPLLHPNQRFIRLADDIYDRTTDWAAFVRDARNLTAPGGPTRRGYAVQHSVQLLAAHLGYLLDEHPDDAPGRAFVDDIHTVWRRASIATGESPVRPVSRDGVPCPNPKCMLASLETEVIAETYTGFVVCRSCGNLYTDADLDAWIARIGKGKRVPAVLQADPDRDARALALRRSGKTYQQIRSDLGFRSDSAARNAVARALDPEGTAPAPPEEAESKPLTASELRRMLEQDPLARPLTTAQVMARTGRSRRTITQWVSDGLLTPYTAREGNRVVRMFLERQVLEVHRERNQAAAETRLNIRRRPGTAPGKNSG